MIITNIAKKLKPKYNNKTEKTKKQLTKLNNALIGF